MRLGRPQGGGSQDRDDRFCARQFTGRLLQGARLDRKEHDIGPLRQLPVGLDGLAAKILGELASPIGVRIEEQHLLPLPDPAPGNGGSHVPRSTESNDHQREPSRTGGCPSFTLRLVEEPFVEQPSLLLGGDLDVAGS